MESYFNSFKLQIVSILFIFLIPIYSFASNTSQCVQFFEISENLKFNLRVKEYRVLIASNKEIVRPKTSEEWLALIEAKSTIGGREVFSFSEFLIKATPREKKKLSDLIQEINNREQWSEYKVKKIASTLYKLTHYKSFSWLELIGFKVPNLDETIVRHIENQVATQSFTELLTSFGKLSSPTSSLQNFREWLQRSKQKLNFGLAIAFNIASISQTGIPSFFPTSQNALNKVISPQSLQVIEQNGFDRGLEILMKNSGSKIHSELRVNTIKRAFTTIALLVSIGIFTGNLHQQIVDVIQQQQASQNHIVDLFNSVDSMTTELNSGRPEAEIMFEKHVQQIAQIQGSPVDLNSAELKEIHQMYVDAFSKKVPN